MSIELNIDIFYKTWKIGIILLVFSVHWPFHFLTGMAFPKLQEFMGEIQKFMDTDEKPFQMSSILPRGAKRELDSAVPMIAGFRPSKVKRPGNQSFKIQAST